MSQRTTEETIERLVDVIACLSLPDRNRLGELVCLLATAPAEAIDAAEQEIWRLANCPVRRPQEWLTELDGVIQYLETYTVSRRRSEENRGSKSLIQ